LGGAWIAAGDFASARLALERARVLYGDDGGNAWLAFHLGFVRAVALELEDSVVEYRRAIERGGIGPVENWRLFYDLGDDYMALGRLAEAIAAYRQAVKAAPQEPMAHLALAVALDRDGQVSRSRSEATTALSLDPQLKRAQSERFVFIPPAEIHYYLAIGHLQRARHAHARHRLRAFVAELPDGPYAGRAREQLSRIETTLDQRELTASTGVEPAKAAAALAPGLPSLERCLGAGVTSVRIARERGRVIASGEGLDEEALACLAQVARGYLPVAPAELWLSLPLAGNPLDTARR
jgi:tetratricopeptide (TPR) repeat protein